MEHEKVLRISELTKISRERELTEAEQLERTALRKEYLEGFKENMQQVLGSILIQEKDGALEPLTKKADTDAN